MVETSTAHGSTMIPDISHRVQFTHIHVLVFDGQDDSWKGKGLKNCIHIARDSSCFLLSGKPDASLNFVGTSMIVM